MPPAACDAARPAANTAAEGLCGETVSDVANASKPFAAAYLAVRSRLYRQQSAQRAPFSGSPSRPAATFASQSAWSGGSTMHSRPSASARMRSESSLRENSSAGAMFELE